MSQIVDFHSHILPDIDDGSKNLEESIAMLQMEQAQGIQSVVATPHFYPQNDQLASFIERRDQAVEILKNKMKELPELPELHVGAEVYYFQGISDCDELPLLTIDGGRYILIEMPHMLWTEEMYRQLEQIYVKRNMYPIIAHIDRYLSGSRGARMVERLSRMPVFIQANAEFFLQRRTGRTALRMLKNEKIHLIGSDCHNLTDRAPNMEAALKKIERRLGPDAIDWINRSEKAVLMD